MDRRKAISILLTAWTVTITIPNTKCEPPHIEVIKFEMPVDISWSIPVATGGFFAGGDQDSAAV